MRQALSSACFSADSEASRFRSLDSTPAMRSSRTFVDDGAWTPPDIVRYLWNSRRTRNRRNGMVMPNMDELRPRLFDDCARHTRSLIKGEPQRIVKWLDANLAKADL